MVKIKQTKNGSFKINGMSCTHLEAISTLINHTRLGNGVYEIAAFDLAEAFDEFDNEFYTPEACEISVNTEDDTPTINLTSVYD